MNDVDFFDLKVKVQINWTLSETGDHPLLIHMNDSID